MKIDKPKHLRHECDIHDTNTGSQNESNLQFEPLLSKIKGSLKLFNFLRNFAKATDLMILYCDNSRAVAQAKEPRNHRKGNHIERKYHLI